MFLETTTLTRRQRQAYEALIRFNEIHQRPPTQTELASAIGRSRTAAKALLRRLGNAGVIELTQRKARGIKLAPESRIVRAPLLRPGAQQEAVESPILAFSADFFAATPEFFVRAEIDCPALGVRRGDLVGASAIVQPCQGLLVVMDDRPFHDFGRLVDGGNGWQLFRGSTERLEAFEGRARVLGNVIGVVRPRLL